MSIKFWEGPSEINGAPIMGYIAGEHNPSSNTKTGPALQVGVMLRGVHPWEAVSTGDDLAICGDCPLRPSNHKAAKLRGEAVADNACYVNTGFKNAQRMSIERSEVKPKTVQAFIEEHAFIRFGEYGNLSSLPREVLEPMLKGAKKWAMYEHEWRRPENQWLREYAMASVHSLEEKAEANALGWRTYRTVSKDDPLPGRTTTGEIWCPNYTHGTTCNKCGLCNGAPISETWNPASYMKDIANPSH